VTRTDLKPLQIGHGDMSRFAVCLALPAVVVVVHELGHLVAASMLGFDVHGLWFAGVHADQGSSMVRFADRLVLAAGGIASWLMIAAGIGSILTLGPNVAGFGIILLECARVSVAFAFGVLTGDWQATVAGYYGHIAPLAALFGEPPPLAAVLVLLETAVPFVALAFVLRRYPALKQPRRVFMTVLSLLIGTLTWFFAVGPALLPRT
jgi:hypothetical protein